MAALATPAPAPLGISRDTAREDGGELDWGWSYLMVEPVGFRVAWSINPFMDLGDQPSPVRAAAQWAALRTALVTAGASVTTMPGDPDLVDMVYAMNLALPARGDLVLSKMRYPERRGESDLLLRWWADRDPGDGQAGRVWGEDARVRHLDAGPEAHFESGDAFWFTDALLVGYGKRTTREGLAALGALVDAPVLGYEITHPSMYHMDLAFCPLTKTAALVCPEAFAPADAEALLARIPDPIVLSAQQALGFAANLVVVGSTVIGPPVDDDLVAELRRRGLRFVPVEVGEFHKGGGSVRCLTNPLDMPIPLLD